MWKVEDLQMFLAIATHPYKHQRLPGDRLKVNPLTREAPPKNKKERRQILEFSIINSFLSGFY